MTPNPCLWCADVAQSCATCLPRLAWEATLLPPEPTPCPVCVDAEWLTLSGELFEQVAARLGKSTKTLHKHLTRHGRDDLLPKKELSWR